jgi:hypothetical protein
MGQNLFLYGRTQAQEFLMDQISVSLTSHSIPLLVICLIYVWQTDMFPFLTSALVAAAILQGLWSLMLAIVDIYALMVKRCLRNRRAVRVFAVGDMVSQIMSFLCLYNH